MIDSRAPVTTEVYIAGCDAPWLSSPDRPTVIGYRRSLPSMMYGSMKLFQIATNWNRNTVTRPAAQVQKLSWTFSAGAVVPWVPPVLCGLPPPEQAVTSSAAAAASTAILMLVFGRVCPPVKDPSRYAMGSTAPSRGHDAAPVHVHNGDTCLLYTSDA